MGEESAVTAAKKRSPHLLAAQGGHVAAPQRGAIKISNLWMRYRPELDHVLRGVSASISPGDKVGVVGRTGAGKSSLVLALFRLVEYDREREGGIQLDGRWIHDMSLAELRTSMCIIPQDPTLFTGSFRSNLDPFEEYDDEAVLAALDAVQLKQVVLDKGGLHAELSESGGNVSVRARQRPDPAAPWKPLLLVWLLWLLWHSCRLVSVSCCVLRARVSEAPPCLSCEQPPPCARVCAAAV